ncbi:uncharacterized protein EKO05_0008439 [Ascochyta rabiei]|uniref:uncharacterized protein n=1 Tax=Didymella rabiei TaxID=5454 RepID=UPI00220C5606|nr:uncharacterized protein EKO05_0008439 [Ascochyta rabiei]UPX18123.1 hypothetical protein EKO05_0008439 [Ascochyta rabiei]
MAILDILDKFMFHSRFKLRIHILTGILVIIVIGLSVPRVFMKNQPRTRAGTIALGMVWASPALHESEILTTARVPNHSSYSCTCSPRSTSPSCVDGAATKQMLSSAVGDRLLGRRRLPRNAGQPVPLRWRDMLSELGRRWTRRYHQLELYALAIAIRELRDSRKSRNGEPLSSVLNRGTNEEVMVQQGLQQPDDVYRAREQREPRYLAQVVRGKQ